MKRSILIIGANGQLGTALTKKLIANFGEETVWPTDIKTKDDSPFNVFKLDALNKEELVSFVRNRKITDIYHLAAVLSANGEKDPMTAWNINMSTLLNVLETARLEQVQKVFFPSSIAVFNESNQKSLTPQDSYLNPGTVYGLSKAAGENWCNYYFHKYNLDVRSLRYPGIIGYDALPGGGTTDYAVDIYHKAIKGEDFTCFLKAETALPMLFMDDATQAALSLMEASKESIKIRTAYNIAGFSLSPADFYQEIQPYFPNFKIQYIPDFRQAIADQWPTSLDDEAAKNDWNWKAKYDLKAMSKIMIEKLNTFYQQENFNHHQYV